MAFVVLGITGSIAAVRAFDLCRELRKQGHIVQVVQSAASSHIITQGAMQWASGRPVISHLSGDIEHIKFFGAKGKADILIIAPATANTISKIAMGIDDTPVTTFATTAIGSKKPVLLAPAMHQPMYEHPIVLENLEKLSKRGVRVIAPLEEDDKAKMHSIYGIIMEMERALNPGKWQGKKVLVASGAFYEKIDDARVITNMSSGKMGAELAKALHQAGAQVSVIGNNFEGTYAKFSEARDAKALEKKVLEELGNEYDWFFCPAAIPDFEPQKYKGKLSSEKEIVVTLKPKKKLLEIVREKFPKIGIVAFKAQWGKTNAQLAKTGKEFLKKRKVNAVVCVNLEKHAFGADRAEMVYVDAKKTKILKGTKKEIAEKIARETLGFNAKKKR
ncbi:MAG: bifunctional phosphopantothenoylcysteine decarboxylase/phosphopantothenate--cysteine ligase CoaBC [archaeon]|nr:bifunctional phosphopantothenoylcysteine decarboxylase/phosphopantothenate--cysteine ligase CoaBC [archaeon]